MSMNNSPSSERLHIAFFGKRNAGKSSVINAVTGQKLSIVSDVLGTTTDPVLKSMELLPLGPVVIIDTPGLDDVGELGKMRVEKALQVLNKTDIAIVVIDSKTGKTSEDEEIIKLISKKNIPYIICYNKSDIADIKIQDENEISVSAVKNYNINELKELIAKQIKAEEPKKIVGDILEKGDIAVLVVPTDKGAPKGRLILPQQQTIRDLLESSNITIVVKETELREALDMFADKVKLVITDSQVFGYVSKIVPENIMLTSFSILFLRYKGELKTAVHGVKALDRLKDNDTVLICEGCTHHRQCEDIGTVKMPAWIKKYTNKSIHFEFTSGGEFPSDLDKYSLIVHCGGCMLNEAEMKSRIKTAEEKGVPITNYGIAIAYINGILERSTEPFSKELAAD